MGIAGIALALVVLTFNVLYLREKHLTNEGHTFTIPQPKWWVEDTDFGRKQLEVSGRIELFAGRPDGSNGYSAWLTVAQLDIDDPPRQASLLQHLNQLTSSQGTTPEYRYIAGKAGGLSTVVRTPTSLSLLILFERAGIRWLLTCAGGRDRRSLRELEKCEAAI